MRNYKTLVEKADIVWLATDEDREGEAIAWHLFEELSLDKDKTRRIVFHEITKGAIAKAIENPRKIDYRLVDAQQARRVLDRLVGFEFSPILWNKVKPSLSAGRVQSVTVRLIVERERDIQTLLLKRSLLTELSAVFSTNGAGKSFKADLNKRFSTVEEARAFVNACEWIIV